MKNYFLGLMIVSVGIVIVSSFHVDAQSDTRPNIIFLLTDDLALSELEFHIDPSSPYYLPDYMPNFKQYMVNQGLNFKNAYVTESLCCPSRVSNLRGQYPHNTGVDRNGGTQGDGGFEAFYEKGHESSTIATWLQSGGYKTALIGKYLNGYPNAPAGSGLDLSTHIPPGWSEWYAMTAVNTNDPEDNDEYNPDGRGNKYYNNILVENGVFIQYGSEPEDYITDVVSNKTVDFINRVGSQPFFIYLSAFAPHAPSTFAPRHANLFEGVTYPHTPSVNESDVSDKPFGGQLLTAEELVAIDQKYRLRLQSMMAVDDLIGNVMQALAVNGKADNTYIFFTSDNGYHFGQHRLKEGKTTAFEEDIHVPLYVIGPGIQQGERDQIVLNNDLAATFIDLAQVNGPTDYTMDGRSFAGMFSSGNIAPWRSHFLIDTYAGYTGALRSITSSDNLLFVEMKNPRDVEPSNANRQLYDRNVDPYELESFYDSADDTIRDKVTARLAVLRRCVGAGCRMAENDTTPGVTIDITPATVTYEDQPISFSAVVNNVGSQDVEWLTEQGGGSIDSSGLYTSTGKIPGTYRVIAVSKADRSVQGVARVNVLSALTLKSITLASATVPSGGKISGKVALTTPPTLGDGQVLMTSSNPEIVAVPDSIIIPQGKTLENFNFTAGAVETSTSVTIKASSGGITKKVVVTIVPNGLGGIASPTSLVGGSTITGKIKLTGAATEETIIDLQSSSPSLSVPTQVTVPVGSSVVSFSITSLPVIENTIARLTALYAGITKIRDITVKLPTVSSLSIAANLPSETKVNGNKVKLNGIAPPGGLIVSLASSDPSIASVPDTVIVKENLSSSVGFRITTYSVATSTPVTITATLNVVSKSKTVNIQPPAPIEEELPVEEEPPVTE